MTFILCQKNTKFEFNTNTETPNFLVKKSNNIIEDSILASHTWDIDNIKLAKKFIKKNTTIIDIGSNMGTFTTQLAKSYKDCTFIAIEPKRNKFLQLCSNLYINNITNTTPYRIALTDNTHKKYLTMYLRSENNKHKEKVPSASLDSLDIDGEVSLIKINAREYEVNTLMGGEGLIYNNLPVIIFESLNSCLHKKHELFAFLAKKDYFIYLLKTDNYIAVQKSKIYEYEFLSKLIFVKITLE